MKFTIHKRIDQITQVLAKNWNFIWDTQLTGTQILQTAVWEVRDDSSQFLTVSALKNDKVQDNKVHHNILDKT